MLTATLTMTPIYSFGLTSRNKTDRAAQAAAFESVGRPAHMILHSGLRPGKYVVLAKKPAAFSDPGSVI
jgi:hypothetical protein